MLYDDESEVERLTMLAEECAEVIHAITKTMRHGPGSKHPLHLNGDDNWQHLEREFAQLVAVARACRLTAPDDQECQALWQRKLRYTHHQ